MPSAALAVTTTAAAAVVVGLVAPTTNAFVCSFPTSSFYRHRCSPRTLSCGSAAGRPVRMMSQRGAAVVRAGRAGGGEDDKPLTFSRSMLKSKSKLDIPNGMGVGTMAWGDETSGFVSDPGYRPKEGEFNPADLQGAYNALMAAGITFFDTSDVYGYKSAKAGYSSEQLLGQFAEESSASPIIAAKYMPILWTKFLVGGPWRAGRRAIGKALERTLDIGGWASVDLYQIHFPFPYLGGMDAMAEGLARACERGLCRSVGVSNFNAQEMRTFADKLKKYDITLASNQFEYSLVNQKKDEDGTLAECKRLGIVPIAHTPLAKGLATGVYTAGNPTGGRMGAPKYQFKDLEPLQPVHEALVSVAKRVQGRLNSEAREEYKAQIDAHNKELRETGEEKTPPQPPSLKKVSTAQISLNYVRAKGMVPLPGVKTKAHADEVIGCLGWSLQPQDVDVLDRAHAAYRQKTGGKTITRGKDRDPWKRRFFTFKKSRNWTVELNRNYPDEEE